MENVEKNGSYMQILIYRTRQFKRLFDEFIAHSCLNNELTIVVNKSDRACKSSIAINTLINSISIIDLFRTADVFLNVNEKINQ